MYTLPAFAGIVCASVLKAPFGAKLAHRLPVKRLKQVFAVLLVVMGTHVLFKLIYSSCLKLCPNSARFLVLIFSVHDPVQGEAYTIDQLIFGFCEEI
jgi:hypothetical protein